MLIKLFQALLFLLPIAAFLLFLRQISSSSANAYRWGMAIFKFQEQQPFEMEKHLINKVIELNGTTFIFLSEETGFFKTRRAGVRPGRALFPLLLGEINLDKSGPATITLRIPFSLFFIFVNTLVAIIGSFILDKGSDPGSLFYQLSAGLVIAFVIFILSLLIEKESIHNGLVKIREYLSENR